MKISIVVIAGEDSRPAEILCDLLEPGIAPGTMVTAYILHKDDDGNVSQQTLGQALAKVYDELYHAIDLENTAKQALVQVLMNLGEIEPEQVYQKTECKNKAYCLSNGEERYQTMPCGYCAKCLEGYEDLEMEQAKETVH